MTNNTEERETFNQLTIEIENLRLEQEKSEKNLEQLLQFYYKKIKPAEMAFVDAVSERIKWFFYLYSTNKNLTKEESTTLKFIIQNDVNQVFALAGFSGISKEINEIVVELNKTEEEKTKPKNDEQINLEQPEPFLFREAPKKKSKPEQEFFRETTKSKKQNPEKSKKKRLKDIYKRLAKILHPDLEQNVDEKVKKEEQMKKLTSAYENQDLYELVSLEIELVQEKPEEFESQDNDQFAEYNAILREQIEKIKKHIEVLIQNPRYAPVRKYCGNQSKDLSVLEIEREKLKKTTEEINTFIEKGKSQDGELFVKSIIEEVTEK